MIGELPDPGQGASFLYLMGIICLEQKKSKEISHELTTDRHESRKVDLKLSVQSSLWPGLAACKYCHVTQKDFKQLAQDTPGYSDTIFPHNYQVHFVHIDNFNDRIMDTNRHD